MPYLIKLENARRFPGAKAGLREKTAVLRLSLSGEFEDWYAIDTLLKQAVPGLRPGEPLWGVGATAWPTAFLEGDNQGPIPVLRWVVALTIALQRWAGDPVWQGRVVRVNGSSATIAIPWARESVVRTAVQFALRYLILNGQPSEPSPQDRVAFNTDLDQWIDAAQARGLAPNTLRFAWAARARNMPVTMLPGMIQLGWGSNAERLDSSFTGHTSVIGTRLARDKFQTKAILQKFGLPVPPGTIVRSWEEALSCTRNLGWPVVVKPSNQDQGAGVTANIKDEVALRRAYEAAHGLSPGAVIVERHIMGNDHRMLVVGGRLMITTRRTPASVVGDGTSTVRQLVDRANLDPRRGQAKRSMLIALALDEEAVDCLSDQSLTTDSIPAAGQSVGLRSTGNISTGGTADDVSHLVHPDNRRLAERAARYLGLDIAGVDFLSPDISRSWHEVGGAVCEVNAQPGFRVHWLGNPERDLNGEILDWLFRDKPARIPTTAISGTHGKTTVARMLHHIWMTSGANAGVCTTHGVWVGEDLVTRQNLSGQPGGEILLADPSVDAAVIEMPRKALIHSGHPCDRYDVAALLNVQDDRPGPDGVNDPEAMARLKAEVLQRASVAAVVNGDDPLALAMIQHAGTDRHILVLRDPGGAALTAHLARGAEAVFLRDHREQPWIAYSVGLTEHLIMPVHEIPATLKGALRYNEVNALFATALALAHGIPAETIRRALAGELLPADTCRTMASPGDH